MKLIFLVIASVAFADSGYAEFGDIAVTAGGGAAVGEEGNRHGISAIGAGMGFPYSTRHRIQIDYVFNNVHGTGSENRHFITGSYLLQGRSGQARPFFQIGAGVVVRSFEPFYVGASGFSRRIDSPSESSFAALLGAGATVDLGRSLFVRPQLRVYGHVGPTFTVLPSVAFGWRF